MQPNRTNSSILMLAGDLYYRHAAMHIMQTGDEKKFLFVITRWAKKVLEHSPYTVHTLDRSSTLYGIPLLVLDEQHDNDPPVRLLAVADVEG